MLITAIHATTYINMAEDDGRFTVPCVILIAHRPG